MNDLIFKLVNELTHITGIDSRVLVRRNISNSGFEILCDWQDNGQLKYIKIELLDQDLQNIKFDVLYYINKNIIESIKNERKLNANKNLPRRSGYHRKNNSKR